MSLDRLNNLFRRRNLTREDIARYGESNDSVEKNKIEQAAESSEFNTDALEGWEMANYDVNSMNRLDKMLQPRNNLLYLGGIAAIFGIILIGNHYLNSNSQPPLETNQLSAEVTTVDVTLDEEDVLIPAMIEDMVEATEKERIEPETIKSDFVEMDSIRELDQFIDVSALPLIDLEENNKEAREVITAHKMAIEVYFHDFKLIDYSHYRDAPEVSTRLIILTGLPADHESELSETPDPIWKDVKVPYMEYIDKTMRIFGSGSYKKALTRFQTILATYPHDVNANFYAGICMYNLKEYQLAISHFNVCRAGGYANFDEEAEWMTALCYDKMSSPKATELFNKIADRNGFYSKQAEKRIQNK